MEKSIENEKKKYVFDPEDFSLKFESAIEVFKLVEAWRKRHYPAYFVSKLSDAVLKPECGRTSHFDADT